jgi:hypothetical protein
MQGHFELALGCVERVGGTLSGGKQVYMVVRVRNRMGISIYIWNVATESEVAATIGSTATVYPHGSVRDVNELKATVDRHRRGMSNSGMGCYKERKCQNLPLPSRPQPLPVVPPL